MDGFFEKHKSYSFYIFEQAELLIIYFDNFN
jgi:hypothetical protein